jgi:hypothetical protein
MSSSTRNDYHLTTYYYYKQLCGLKSWVGDEAAASRQRRRRRTRERRKRGRRRSLNERTNERRSNENERRRRGNIMNRLGKMPMLYIISTISSSISLIYFN